MKNMNENLAGVIKDRKRRKQPRDKEKGLLFHADSPFKPYYHLEMMERARSILGCLSSFFSWICLSWVRRKVSLCV